VAGKLDVSIQHKRTLRGSRKSKTNDSDLVGGITHDRPTKSPITPSRQRNGSFDDVDKKSDDENTFDKEMIADGKVLVSSVSSWKNRRKSKSMCLIIHTATKT